MKTAFDGRAPDGKDEWLTPKYIIDALGPFDLDPCSPVTRPWPTATRHLTLDDNGLAHRWEGRVWLNPPYGPETGRWLKKLAQHGDGIALTFARTETAFFFSHIWGHATALLFLRGRLKFHHVDGSESDYSGGAPSVLVAYGTQSAAVLLRSGLKGVFVSGWIPTNVTPGLAL